MKKKKILALTLGLGLAVGSLTGTYTMAQANQKPAEIQNMQRGHEKPMFDKANHQDLWTLLQIDEKTFKQEADSGKSLVEIAAAHNVSRQDVIDLVVKNMNQQIDKGLAEKRITAEQANEMKSNAVEKAQQMVDEKPMGFNKMHGPERNGHGQPMFGRQNHQEMLTLLQIDEQTFKQEADSGKSLVEIAAAHNVSRQAVIDLVVKNMNQQIDQRLADSITAEQANEMKSNAVEKAQQMVDKKMMGFDKMHGPEKNGHEQPMHDQQNHQELLTLLQIDEQTFTQEANSGKSLVEIASAHNVSRQAVIDFVVKNMNQQIDKGLSEKRITAEQANEMKTSAVEKAQEMVDKKIMEHPAQPQR